jgi:hypothetical protein
MVGGIFGKLGIKTLLPVVESYLPDVESKINDFLDAQKLQDGEERAGIVLFKSSNDNAMLVLAALNYEFCLHGTGAPNLRTQNFLLPTPNCADAHKTTKKSHQNNLNKTFQTGKTSQLSPLFVAEMMGFPSNWTLSPFLDESAEPSAQHSEGGEKNPFTHSGTQ